MNAAQKEVLVSFLISQGQTRVRAGELVDQDSQKVQAQMDAVEKQQAKVQPQGPAANPDPQVQHPNTPDPPPGQPAAPPAEPPAQPPADQEEEKKNLNQPPW